MDCNTKWKNSCSLHKIVHSSTDHQPCLQMSSNSLCRGLVLKIHSALDAWICISTTLWFFKTKPWQKLFDEIWRHGWWSVDECTILCKEQEFFHFVLQSIFCFRFYCRTRSKPVFLKRYQSLKLNHDTDCLMTSEDTVEDPLMSVQFYIKIQSFFISCDSHSTVFIFIAKDAWICISTTLWIFKTKPWHLKTRLKMRWWVFNFL